MLNITKGVSNELYVTATEKTTITGASYLFVFTHALTSEIRAFVLPNTSSFTARYDLFTFTEGSTTQKTLGYGTHYYKIYAQISTTNLDPELADEEVERGIAYIPGTQTINEDDSRTTIKSA